MHEIVESEAAPVVTPEDKLVFWEALRDRVSTIGARDAVDEAIRQMEVES